MVEHERLEEFARVARERDLYHRLLELGAVAELEPFLRESLALVVELTGARQGYLELDSSDGDRPRWWIAQGFMDDQIERVRSKISNSIVAKSLATGKTVVTPSAMLDPEFDQFDSIRLKQIEAVLCAPIGDTPKVGVVYLQGRERPGLFDRDERWLAETFARHLAPLASRLLVDTETRGQQDPTAAYRDRLELSACVGRSTALAAVFEAVALAAPRNVGLLLTGDNGTGKSQLAEVIHANGPRASSPFVELNCATLPPDLIESELFGAATGAYTGAVDRPGKVAAAEGGTLFLDEVSEIPLGAQGKLLQLLQKKTYYRLGADQPQSADVRVIAATNIDLPAAVSRREFREDLYYRLDILKIRVPSLAERIEDIPYLVRHFCEIACRRHELGGLGVSQGAELAARTSPWPGNVRQLSQAVEVAALRANSEGATILEAGHLFPDDPHRNQKILTFQDATRHFQAELVRRTLERNDWNVTQTAVQLDVARSYVYTLMRTLGIER